MTHWSFPFRKLTQELNSYLHPLKSRLLNDPYYRFQSLQEVNLAAQLGIRIDANRASLDDWLRLPGLSIHQARTLVRLGQSGVQFYSLDDIAAALSLPPERLQPFAPVLMFCHYEADGLTTLHPISANRSSAEMLTRIPNVDLYLARAIVANRDRYGPYTSMADLQQRLTLPPPVTATLMHYLVFD